MSEKTWLLLKSRLNYAIIIIKQRFGGGYVIRVAIVDDIIEICGQIENYLHNISNRRGIEIEAEPYLSGERFCDALQNGEVFDIIFLDIELKSMNGIDVSKFIREVLEDELQQIVFISAKQQYSMELHFFHPLDFLVKDIKEAEVEVVLQRFMKIKGIWSETFECKIGADIKKIKIKEIRYLSVDNRVVNVILSNGQSVEYYGTLESAYNDQLKKCGFLFLHKKYVVNPDYIEIYEYDKVTMCDGQNIPIGSSRRKEIRAWQAKNTERRKNHVF